MNEPSNATVIPSARLSGSTPTVGGCVSITCANFGGDGVGAMWGRELAAKYLEHAGFGSWDIHQLEHDFQNDYYVIRP